jgi:hypothetical protein
VRARNLAQQREMEQTSYEVRYDETERRWYRGVSAADQVARIVTTGLVPWDPVREDEAPRQMAAIVEKRLVLTQ